MKRSRDEWLGLILGVTATLTLITVTNNELIRCTEVEDCPQGGFCFKDECARCLCPEGSRVINLYDGGKLTKICRANTKTPNRVGNPCDPANPAACPHGSLCDDVTGVCICDVGLRAHKDFSHCRRGVYQESCDSSMRCEKSLGLTCKRSLSSCQCKSSHHRPNAWTRYVLGRWDYSQVQGEPQDCVARAVGEPCRTDQECAAVEGSEARCGDCGFCECKIGEHVPNVLGTKCGPGLGPGQNCGINPHFVCDGTRGLQCGDVCDLYDYDFRRKQCKCSQMHDRVGTECAPKRVGSPCVTDLDCYPVMEGFGYCHNSRCAADIPASGPDYMPYLVNRKCQVKKPIPSPPGVIGGKQENLTNVHKYKHPTDRYTTEKESRELRVDFGNLTGIFEVETTTQPTKLTTIKAFQRDVTSRVMFLHCKWHWTGFCCAVIVTILQPLVFVNR